MEKDTLADDKADFALCDEHEADQRKESLDDLEFALLEKQWHEEDRSQREAQGRPCLTINRLPAFAKQVINDGKMNRPSIAVKPIGDGASKDTADIQSDLIRNIETSSQSDIVYDTALTSAVYCGLGYFRVNVDYTCDDGWDQDIFLERISNVFSVYGDYEGKELTSIDWNRAFVTDWVSKSTFEARWGKDRQASNFDTGGGDYDQQWFNDKRIRVAERWLRDEVPTTLIKLSNGSLMMKPEFLKVKELLDVQGITINGTRETKTYKVKQRLITGTDILEENDWLGKYIPIVPMYGEEVNISGKRYFISLIRRAKDSQRLYNYQRTLSAELGGLQPKAPWLGPKGMFDSDHARWATANRVNHPYLEYDVVPDAPGASPQRIPFAGPPAGAMQEAMMASDDMKSIMGIHDASLGARSNETSGKAIMARQREGDTSTFNFIDNRNKAVEHGGRIILDLMPKVYTVERILRCIQDDGSTYTVPVNQPVANKSELEKLLTPPQQMQAQPGVQAMQPGQEPMTAPDQQPQGGPPEYVPVPRDIEAQLDPQQLGKLKAITKIFDLTVGKYDVTVTAGPSFTTRREESATQMMEFIRIFPQAAPLIGDLLAKNLDWPGADQVAERLKAMLPPQAAGKVPPMVQQLQQMLQQQDGQAKQAIAQLQQQITQMQKELADKAAEQQLKAREIGVKEFDAETKRMEMMKPQQQDAPQPPDPIEVAKLEQNAEKLRIESYEAETERLQVLGATITPEQIQLLVQQTVMQALTDTPIATEQTTIIVQPPDPVTAPLNEPPEGGFFMGEPEVPAELMSGGGMQPPIEPPPVGLGGPEEQL